MSSYHSGRACWATLLLVWGAFAPPLVASAQENRAAVLPALPTATAGRSLLYRVQGPSQRMEMTVNTSRILTLDAPFPKVQVNNPDLLELNILSATEVQVFAKKPGVTQVNLWKEDESIVTVDVIVYGDAQELEMLLASQFPNSRLKVIPLPTSVVITGYVDQPSHVRQIIEIAQDFHPKVINNISIDGVQQVLLHVKVMEVSRTKIRNAGFDFGLFNSNDFLATGVSGLVGALATGGASSSSGAPPPGTTFGAEATGGARAATSTGLQPTASFGIVSGNTAFFGVLDSLVQKNLAKTLSEPTLVTVSGRPAYFNVGGEVPVPASGLGAANVTFRPFGTQIDFVPIVRGGGRLRLEVRPRISDIDPSIAVSGIPGFRVRVIDTGVDMMAGETLALGGLVQTRMETQTRGLPWLSDLPYAGALFRKTNERTNEIELLIMVTPQLAAAMACEDVPPGGPGLEGASPTEIDFYLKGHVEVPGHVQDGNRRTPKQNEAWNDYYPASRDCVIEDASSSGEVHIESRPARAPREVVPTPPAPLPQPADAARSEAATRTPARPASTRRAAPVVSGNGGGSRDNRQNPRNTSPAARKPQPQPGLVGPSGYDVEN